jgi:hypothetical protein
MKTEVRDGKTITIFDNVEEMKWHYHARLCRNSADIMAQFMVDFASKNVAEANKWLKILDSQYEVKT